MGALCSIGAGAGGESLFWILYPAHSYKTDDGAKGADEANDRSCPDRPQSH
jgi:hypothetical protein